MILVADFSPIIVPATFAVMGILVIPDIVTILFVCTFFQHRTFITIITVICRIITTTVGIGIIIIVTITTTAILVSTFFLTVTVKNSVVDGFLIIVENLF